MNALCNRRILLIDDLPAIHEDFRKILIPRVSEQSDLSADQEVLFGDEPRTAAVAFELDSGYQGQDGLAMLQAALRSGRPYAMAFVDMRMPTGWDGVETIERLWEVDERLQVVICTAFSDHSWDAVLARLQMRDRLLVLKKPFDAIEVTQLAHALTDKWQMTQQAAAQLSLLEEAVRERTRELTCTNQALQTQISERKQLESQLVQSGKLASIGQLAAGVAHEINNPIAYVFSNLGTLDGYLERLFRMLSAYESVAANIDAPDVVAGLLRLRTDVEIDFLREDIHGLIRESTQGIERVRKIVLDLKDFSRIESTQEWQWADLHEGIESTLNMVSSEIKYRATVVKQFGEIPRIECLPSQVNQVVMNLVMNAAQAIGTVRGEITIRTTLKADTVWLEVTDTGCGMSDETQSRIFDPFFTTKPVGKGTGLGLSLSYGIVQKHGGRIDVQSTLGQGTTFRVGFPVRRNVSKNEAALGSS
jgi:two-component system, NtrC family, sensor kinase